jgi:hypothetical protein
MRHDGRTEDTASEEEPVALPECVGWEKALEDVDGFRVLEKAKFDTETDDDGDDETCDEEFEELQGFGLA